MILNIEVPAGGSVSPEEVAQTAAEAIGWTPEAVDSAAVFLERHLQEEIYQRYQQGRKKEINETLEAELPRPKPPRGRPQQDTP